MHTSAPPDSDSAAPAEADAAVPAFAGAEAPTRELLLQTVRWPRPSRLDTPLDVGSAKAAAAAAALGLRTVGELFEHLPSSRREARTLAALQPGESATVAVQVRTIRARPVRRRGMRPLVEATVADDTGSVRAVFFNQPWLSTRYPAGTRLVLHGKLERGGRFNVSHHAPAGAREVVEAEPEGQANVAHYPATEGLSSTQILALVRASRGALADVVEALPAGLRRAERLPERAAALGAVHFANEPGDAETGRRRLAFEELLLLQLLLLRRRARRRARAAAAPLSEPPTLTERWLERGLPFALTGDQHAAIEAIAGDLGGSRPMQRLLIGEVGSGKTVVSLYAMLRAVELGMQAALMAPTETLAEQHFATLQTLLGGENLPLALLTGSTRAARRNDILAKLASGELALVVGTHALIEPTVTFSRLAVAVIDEQHRFGVRQRAALDAKGRDALVPHTLHMTATPIPRTLALRNYGDLDFTLLRELPRGRQPIDTRIVSGEAERERAYAQIISELRAGRQAFVVCPLVDHDDSGAAGDDARAAKAEYERLAGGELAGFRVALLHGQMSTPERQHAMRAFASGEAQVLVATTVIEVGIDVPNATLMLVENAERFGIAQLHQLRGRVGRGAHRSTCLLCGPRSSSRLAAVARHSDGFRLAEIDLELRNEGELAGTRQSGAAQFRVARMPEDAALLESARAHAEAIVAADCELAFPEHALLAWALQRAYGDDALEPIPA